MAIIYTYPLLDPIVGTELVIVSDSTAARNTRQTTVAALGAFFCALCPDTDTTYDLTAVQNAANADITLTPSVGAADIVKLIAGTNVTLTTLFNNVTIDVPHLVIEDEGVPLTPTGTASIDFVGAGVTATTIGTDVTVTIPGGGGAALDIKEEGVSVEANTISIDFIGAGATAAALGAGAVSVTIPGGGSTPSAGPINFIPLLVTQGVDGLAPLAGIDTVITGFAYIDRAATYYVIDKQVYFDFFFSWNIANIDEVCTGAPFGHTLGVAVGTGAGNLTVAGLDTLVPELKTSNKNNAGVHITETLYANFDDPYVGAPATDNWTAMPQGGKLNHFYNGAASVAWLHWHRNMTAPGGALQIDYSPQQYAGADWWGCPETGVYRMHLAGSFNPITVPPL